MRWFTPTLEVVLCGHATLATAHVLFNEISRGLTYFSNSLLENTNDTIYFETLSGELVVKKSKTLEGVLSMDFPQFTETFVIDPSIGDNLTCLVSKDWAKEYF